MDYRPALPMLSQNGINRNYYSQTLFVSSTIGFFIYAPQPKQTAGSMNLIRQILCLLNSCQTVFEIALRFRGNIDTELLYNRMHFLLFKTAGNWFIEEQSNR